MSFSMAALARLVECCTNETLHGASTDALAFLPALERLITDGQPRGLDTGLEDFDTEGQEFWGIPATTQRVFAIAGLIELGLSVGYLDFTADESSFVSTMLEVPFREFQEKTVSRGNEAERAASAGGMQLLSRLIERLATRNLSAIRREEALVGVFESYANLTSYVWSDSGFHQFLLDTHSASSMRILDDDLACLVTPRHFASAVATGFIGEKPAAAADGGLTTLKHFDWFSAILASVGDHPIVDDFIRDARWAHSVDRVADRIGVWASMMSEWTDESDIDEVNWNEFASTVFGSLSARQRKLKIPEITPKGYLTSSRPAGGGTIQPFLELTEQVKSLKAEGRGGGARRVAVQQASRLYAALWSEDTLTLSKAEELMKTCSLISELGDADVAAAYVAPIRARAKREIKGDKYFWFDVADKILLKARTTPSAANPPVATSTGLPSTIAPAGEQSTQRLRSGGSAHPEPTNLG